MKAHLVEELVEQSKFVGCEHKPAQHDAGWASESRDEGSEWIHVRENSVVLLVNWTEQNQTEQYTPALTRALQHQARLTVDGAALTTAWCALQKFLFTTWH